MTSAVNAHRVKLAEKREGKKKPRHDAKFCLFLLEYDRLKLELLKTAHSGDTPEHPPSA